MKFTSSFKHSRNLGDMWIPLVAIFITTCLGLLSLWNDEIFGSKQISSVNSDEKKKLLRGKVIKTFLIALTLAISFFQIIKSGKETKAAKLEKQNQHRSDSTRYVEDSLRHISERREDARFHTMIDSVKNIQIEAYKAQIAAGKSLDNIKSKSSSILNNLTSIDTLTRNSALTIERLRNPIPQSLDILFFSTLKLSDTMINQIGQIVAINPARTNLLPFDINKTNSGWEKINTFKNVQFQLTFIFRKDGKTMTIRLDRGPLSFYGYNAFNSQNSFHLWFNDNNNSVNFEGRFLKTEDIRTNYNSPSLLDFENSEVSLEYIFFFPSHIRAGNMPANIYWADKPNYFPLQFSLITLQHRNYTIHIKNLKQTDVNKYIGDWSF